MRIKQGRQREKDREELKDKLRLSSVGSWPELSVTQIRGSTKISSAKTMHETDSLDQPEYATRRGQLNLMDFLNVTNSRFPKNNGPDEKS